MSEDTPKRVKIPRPQKRPLRPLAEHQTANPLISESQEQLIGRAVVQWSKLEASLNDLIWLFLNLDIEQGRIITSRMDATSLLTTARALAPYHLKGEELDKVLDALDSADNLREDRNFIVHGTWGTVMPDNIPVALSLRPKMELGLIVSESFKPDRMHRIIHEIDQAKSVFAVVINAHGPLREKPQQSNSHG